MTVHAVSDRLSSTFCAVSTGGLAALLAGAELFGLLGVALPAVVVPVPLPGCGSV